MTTEKCFSYLEFTAAVFRQNLNLAARGCNCLLQPEATTFMMSHIDFSRPEAGTGPATSLTNSQKTGQYGNVSHTFKMIAKK